MPGDAYDTIQRFWKIQNDGRRNVSHPLLELPRIVPTIG